MVNKKKTHDVFGISNLILADSYVNRGNLDEEINRCLSRNNHIALRGESKCGKSWLRQKNISNAVVVQCRFGKTVVDIYTDALSQLGIKLTIEQNSSSSIKGRAEAQTSFGTELLAKIGLKTIVEENTSNNIKNQPVGQDINDLRFIADILNNSGKRLVIEDFHYLSVDERKKFAYDLKALWDYGCFVVIIGVWPQSNMLAYLNPDLTGRIVEKSIYWSDNDLCEVINNGCKALKVSFSQNIKNELISNCFGNVGILQKLVLLTLDKGQIFEEQETIYIINDINYFNEAAKEYATELNAFYQQFARRVSNGIRKRNDSTGIYAHAMAVIVETEDSKLLNGLDLDEIYQIAHSRQPRIQKGNLKVILGKLEELQVDEDGRGLVVAFDESNNQITAIDRQLLFYRRYLTVDWPWHKIIEEGVSNGKG